jgi:hypothetical protein
MGRRELLTVCAIHLGAVACGGHVVSSSPGTPPVGASTAPADGRCDLVPRMLVGTQSLQALSDAGSTQVRAGAIALSATDVYYTATVATVPMYSGLDEQIGPIFLMRVPWVGGPSTVVASGRFLARPAINSSSVVLLDQGSDGENAILTIPLAGGPPSTVATFSVQPTNGFVADDSFAYFATLEGIDAVSLVSGGGDAGIIGITQNGPPTGDISFPDGIGLFGEQLLFGLSQGGIESVPLPPRPNAVMTSLGSGSPGLLDVMPCGASSCWVGWQEYGFEELDHTGHVLSTIPTSSFLWSAAAFDGTTLFVLAEESFDGGPPLGVLQRILAASASMTTLGTMPSAGDVAVDDECVYWSNTEGVFSLSKTAMGFSQ